jgi:hypothetical protein
VGGEKKDTPITYDVYILAVARLQIMYGLLFIAKNGRREDAGMA